MKNLGTRQIHLDFHNSGVLTPLGADFDATEFADRLLAAKVTSVNLFAKCHHGYSYYPTSVGVTHPGLRRDLLGEQLAALRAVGIAAPVYVSIMWDDLAGIMHPEWVAADIEGRLLARRPFSADSVHQGKAGWTVMDLASGYGQYVIDQVKELCIAYRPDGFWFDIATVVPSYTPASIARMERLDVDPSDPDAVETHYLRIRDDFIAKVSAVIRGFDPDTSIVYNQTIDAWLPGIVGSQTQLDVESLPTSGGLWGYTHYPVYARYARTFGTPIAGMNGRFHRSWADFGGLKTRDQLGYEVSTILAAGGRVCIGDQLDPSGRLDPAVYRLIGETYDRVEALEPWLTDAQPVSEVAVVAAWVHASPDPGRRGRELSSGVTGAGVMLGELAVQYDVIDATRIKPGEYRLIVVPDDADLNRDDIAALEAARTAGAAILSAGSALFDRTGAPLLAGSPVACLAPAATTICYSRMETLAEGDDQLDPHYPYVSYSRAFALRPSAGAEPAGTILEACFDRTWEHFTSHGHPPVGERRTGPLVCSRDGVTIVGMPLFSGYATDDYWVASALLCSCLNRMLPGRVIQHDGPPWLEAAVLAQPEAPGRRARRIVHLTAFQPRRTAGSVPRVDRTHALGPMAITMAVDAEPMAVYRAPSREPVSFTASPGAVTIALEVVEPVTVLVVETLSVEPAESS